MTKTFQIGVVGMGAVGSAGVVRLLRRLQEVAPDGRFRVVCFEQGHEIGSGLAYSTTQDVHILNMRASTMSLDPDSPDDFVEWMAAQNLEAQSEYVPRHWFGRYVRERFQAAVAGSPVAVEVLFEEVIDCEERPEGVELTTTHARHSFDCVLLSVGHLAEPVERRLRFRTPRFFSNPWSFPEEQAIDPQARIGVLGSSLSAVDAIVALENLGFRGQITCFSRRRSLPKVQARRPPVALKHVNRETLAALTENFTRKLPMQAVLDLFKREFLEFENGAELWQLMIDKYADAVADDLRASLQRVENGEVLWHTILDATSYIISEVWNNLDEPSREHFHRICESNWAMFRHSMPEVNARKLLAIAERGNLQAYAGLEEVRFERERKVFQLKCRPKEAPETTVVHEVDYLIDATGGRAHLDELHSPLLSRMLERGQLQKHPYGGVAVDFATSRLRFADGSLSRRIAFAGVHTRGVHFYTNSFEMNRDRVFEAIESLIEALSKSPDLARQVQA